MFNATNGQAVLDQKVETSSDNFAAWFDTLDGPTRQDVLDQLNDRDMRQSLVDGTIGQQQSQGQQPPALGSGTQPGPAPQPTVIDETEALDVLVQSPNISNGVKAALRRLLSPRDPHPLLVENDGTPSELRASNQAKADAEAQRDTARDQLAEERDATHPGSLAHQLADAQAAAVVPANMVDKATQLANIQAVEAAAGNLSTSMMTSHISGVDELNQAVTAAKAAVS